jgi:hypothetical protein
MAYSTKKLAEIQRTVDELGGVKMTGPQVVSMIQAIPHCELKLRIKQDMTVQEKNAAMDDAMEKFTQCLRRLSPPHKKGTN